MGKSAFDIVARLNTWHVPKSGPASDFTSYHVVCCVCIRYRSSDWAPYTCKRGMASFRPASYIQSIMCYFWCLIIWAVFISMSAYWRPTKLGTWNVFEGFNAQELHLVFLIAVHWIDKGYISSIGLPWFNWSLIRLLWHRASGPDIFACTADAGDKTRRDEKLCVARICVKLRPHKTRTRMSSFLFVFSACLS